MFRIRGFICGRLDWQLQQAFQVRMIDPENRPLIGPLWMEHHLHQPLRRLQRAGRFAECIRPLRTTEHLTDPDEEPVRPRGRMCRGLFSQLQQAIPRIRIERLDTTIRCDRQRAERAFVEGLRRGKPRERHAAQYGSENPEKGTNFHGLKKVHAAVWSRFDMRRTNLARCSRNCQTMPSDTIAQPRYGVIHDGFCTTWS